MKTSEPSTPKIKFCAFQSEHGRRPVQLITRPGVQRAVPQPLPKRLAGGEGRRECGEQRRCVERAVLVAGALGPSRVLVDDVGLGDVFGR